MKTKILVAFAAFSLLLSPQRCLPAEKSPVATDLDKLIQQVKTKLKAEKSTEQDLADELKAFDALLVKYKDDKSDDVAQVLFMKAMLYAQVFDNSEKATALYTQLKQDFPNTQQGKNADKMIESMKQQEESKKIQRALAIGSKFPDFDEKDVTGKPLSIGKYKGKVVLVDFWATWCGPCVSELPNVLKTYEKHHPEGFEIVGISPDQSEDKLTKFTKEKNMPWQQYFDGKGWGNKLAGKYGVQSIPMTYLLDGEGRIIAKGARGEDLEKAVVKALNKS